MLRSLAVGFSLAVIALGIAGLASTQVPAHLEGSLEGRLASSTPTLVSSVQSPSPTHPASLS